MPKYIDNAKPNHVATAIHNVMVGTRSDRTGSAHMTLLFASEVVGSQSNVINAQNIADFIDKSGPYRKGQPTKEQPIQGNDLKDRVIRTALKGATGQYVNDFDAALAEIKALGETVKGLAKDNTIAGRTKLQKAQGDLKIAEDKVRAVRAMASRALTATREILRANGTKDWDINVDVDVSILRPNDRGSIMLPLPRRGEYLALSMNTLIKLGRMADKERREWLDAHYIDTGAKIEKESRGAQDSDVTAAEGKATKLDRAVKRAVAAGGMAGIGAQTFGMIRALDNVTDIVKMDQEETQYNLIADLHAVQARIADLLEGVEDLDQYLSGDDDDDDSNDEDDSATGTDG